MKLIELIRLMLKHWVILLAAPLIMAGLVIMLTREPNLKYTSSTVLYTGIATGSSIEMDKTINYFAANSAFDNLINIIKSRETQEAVAIRLLSQHLMLKKAEQKFISAKSHKQLKENVPAYIYKYVVTEPVALNIADSSLNAEQSQVESNPDSAWKYSLFPASLNRSAFEKTVENLTALMKSSDTNYVYKLLNYEDKHYSIKAISSVKAERIGNSDLIKLTYEVDDPGICQQTLAFFNEVCIRNYKNIKENRSDAVVKYFESQLAKANLQLKDAEDKLLGFNKSNNIINYYEQSKAVAVVKEEMEVDYSNKKAQLAGTLAATKRLEEKLDIQQLVQLKSNNVLEKRKQLADITYELASTEAQSGNSSEDINKLVALRKKSESLKSDIKNSVGELYHYQNSIEGLPVSRILSDWINNVIESENLKAKLKVMDERNKEFQQQYAIYAPAGANIKRIEREISVSEQGYLELLHGLNLAKLKLQDNELTTNLKTVDPPYFPLQSMPTKRAVLVIAAGLIGFIIVLGIILFMEYADDTLKNIKKAGKILQLPAAGMLPKILLNPGKLNLNFIQNRLVEMAAQQIEQLLSKQDTEKRTSTVLFISTQEKEGKTIAAANIARKLVSEGKKVLVLNYDQNQEPGKLQRRFPLLNRMMGYQDPRIDFNSPFLSSPAEYLPAHTYITYRLNDHFYKTRNYDEILIQNGIEYNELPDYVFIELPALLYNNYPVNLVKDADLSILVCRANRLWSEADQSSLETLLTQSPDKINFIINGVELKETESLLGQLPEKSSAVRSKIKNLVRFQFFSKNQI